MPRRGLPRPAGMLLAVALLSVPWSPDALAQTPIARPETMKFGDWLLRCSPSPGSASKRCVLLQNVVMRQSGKRIVNVSFSRGDDGPDLVATVTAPLGILLTNGLALHVDGRDIAQFPLRICNVNGCRGDFVLTDNMRTALRSGERAAVKIHQPNGRPFRVQISLEGFGDGLAALAER